MLQRIKFIVLAMMLALPLSSQDRLAEIWLEKVTTQLKDKGVEINFRVNEEGIRIGGRLLMEGNNYFFDTDEMKIWYDGTTQWTLQINYDYDELYINEPTFEDQLSINPYLLLNNYQEMFTATDGGDKNLGGVLVHEVVLTAKDNAHEVESLYIYIKGSGELAALHLLFPDDRTYKIDVRSMRSGLTFPKSTFTYDAKAHPSDEVIDMR